MNLKNFMWLILLTAAGAIAFRYSTSEEGDFIHYLPAIFYLIALIPIYHLRVTDKYHGLIIGSVLLIGSSSIFNFDLGETNIYPFGFLFLLVGTIISWRAASFELKSEWKKWIVRILIGLLILSSFYWLLLRLNYHYDLNYDFFENVRTSFYWLNTISNLLLPLVLLAFSIYQPKVYQYTLIILSVMILLLGSSFVYQIELVRVWQWEDPCTSCELLEKFLSQITSSFVIYLVGCLLYFLLFDKTSQSLRINFIIVIIGSLILFFISQQEQDSLELKLDAEINESLRQRHYAEESAANSRDAEAHALLALKRAEKATKDLEDHLEHCKSNQ